jgi:ubiquinone/menaquinone biosynthesis C-methylase UbiE
VDEFGGKAASWDLDPAKVERAGRVAGLIREQAGPLGAARVLEYGCGTGLLGFALQPHVAQVTLADASEGMLAVLRRKIAASGAGNLVPVRTGAGFEDIPGAPFDLLCTLMTLHHVPDTAGALAWFRRLLVPGGLLCISDLDQEDGSFHGAWADVHRGFARDALERLLAAAGFRDIRFRDAFSVERTSESGTRSYPAFLVLARAS